MLSLALGWPRERVPDRLRTLVATADAVWIWPGIPLTLRRGTEILPRDAETIRFFVTRLHGPDALYKDSVRAVERATVCLKNKDESGAQRILDDLHLTELSRDGAALMRAVSSHLNIYPLDLPLRASMRTWNVQDIALHLPIFKRHFEAARALRKGAIPFDPAVHPRWPAGAPDSEGGEFAPAGGSDAAIIPVASRGSGKPPKGEKPAGGAKPNKPSKPVSPEGSSIRYLEPGEWPEGANSPTGLQTPPNLLGPEDLRPGIGHNSGDPTPLDDAPESPPQPPAQAPAEPPPEPAPQIPRQPLSVTARNLFIKEAVRWIARALILAAAPDLGPYLIALQTAYWVAKECWPYIKAYFQAPKTWEELQAHARDRQPGYDIHHPVEQTQAVREGYPKSLWDGPGNRLRIPTLKHWQITGWYMTKNYDPKYGGLSPRDYLKGKNWAEKMAVGHEALVKFGVLKP